MNFKQILESRKYELLLVGLLQHLFIGIFLSDMIFYRNVVWPINMLVLGLASGGVFIAKEKWKNVLRSILFSFVLGMPILLPFFETEPMYFIALNIIYIIFFAFIFWEVMTFLIKPSYINADIISASACGYLLLIEISVFTLQFLFYLNPNSLKGVNTAGNSETFIDLVYFCSITLTSIGFGDITPGSTYTKLITALIGIVGQFYSVVLVGILISKFVSSSEK